MRAFITGVSGFVGRSLVRQLTSPDWEVFGIDRNKSDLGIPTTVGNIRESDALSETLREYNPSVVFHLAGMIKSTSPQEYYAENVLGTLSLFEALLKAHIKPRVIIASSSAVYGPGLGNRAISENFSLRPVTDYAASKVAQEAVARRFFLAHNFPIIIVRTFNLVGPGQPADLACSAFARQIALDETKHDPAPIKTGNLSAKRDFVDVRDGVCAYELLAKKGNPGAVYNVCSGQAVSLQHCLDMLIEMSTQTVKTEPDMLRMQKNDVPFQVGSNKRIHRTTGWNPQITIKKSLLDLLDNWREKLRTIAE